MWGAGWPQDRDRARPGRCLRTITADRSTGCCGPRSAPDRAWPSPCTVRSRPGRHGIQLESDPHLVLPPQHPAHDPRAGRPGPQPGPPRRSRRPPAGFDREAYRHRTVGEVVLCIDAAAVWWMWAVGLGRGRHRIRATTSVGPRPRAERRRRSGATAPLSPRAPAPGRGRAAGRTSGSGVTGAGGARMPTVAAGRPRRPAPEQGRTGPSPRVTCPTRRDHWEGSHVLHMMIKRSSRFPHGSSDISQML